MTSNAAGGTARNTVTNDAISAITGGVIAAWIDEYPASRCRSSHRLTTADGGINVRCDAQAGHAGDRHQALINGAWVYWRDDPADRPDESEDGDALAPQGDGS